MPSIYNLKPRFQSLLRPLVRRLAESGVSANQVTIAAFILSFLVGGLIALNPTSKPPLLLMPITLFIRATDRRSSSPITTVISVGVME